MAGRERWVGAFALLLGGSVSAYAQTGAVPATPATEAADQPGDIIVTAERRATRLQETPIAISVLSQSTLDNRLIFDTAGIQNQVPGLRFIPNVTAPTNFTVSLRGSSQQDASLVVAESPVGIYVDDIYIARLNGANAQLADIDRIEVLRGPQGTLYGRNTLAGALRIITRTPADALYADLFAGYGSFNKYQLRGAIGGPLGGGFSASIAGVANGNDGFFFNRAIGERKGFQDNAALRGKLRFRSGGFEAQAFVSWANGVNDAYTPVPGTVPNAPQISTNQVQPTFGFFTTAIARRTPVGIIQSYPRGRTDQTIAGLNLSYDFGGITVKSITGYVRTIDFFNVDFTGFGAFYGANRSVTDQYSQEFQLLGRAFDNRLNYIAGAFLFQEDATQTVQLVTDDRIAINTKSIAFFGQATYRFTDRLQATAGIRWTEDDKRFGGSINPLLFPVPVFNFRSNDVFSAVTPKFSLEYKLPASGPLDSTLLYFSAGRGFKSGGYNGIAFGNPTTLSTVYGPETNWTYEAGFKTELFQRALRLNAAFFQNEISNIALNAEASGPGGVSFPVQNAGDARIRGIELEATVVPTRSLTLFTNLTLQDARYTRLLPQSTAFAAAQQFGSATPPNVPGVSLTSGFDWVQPLTSGARPIALKIGADVFHSNSYFLAVGNDIIVDAYTRANAYVALDFNNRVEARFGVRNLTDDATVISGIRAFGGYIVLPPRQLLFTLSFKR